MAAGDIDQDYGWGESEPLSHGYLDMAIAGSLRKLQVKRVLDLGCGNGALCHSLSRQGYDCTGCDADKAGVEIAQKRSPDVNFMHLGVYDDPALLGNSDFDVVVSAEVIEHLYYPRSLAKFARSVLKDDGYLIVTTPYHGYIKNLVLSLLGKWDHHHTALWDGGHIKFWSRKTLTELLESEGFVVKEFSGVGRFPYLWKSMLLVAQRK